jgi:hypothetical protein
MTYRAHDGTSVMKEATTTRAQRISRNLQRANKAQQARDARDATEEKARVQAALERMRQE